MPESVYSDDSKKRHVEQPLEGKSDVTETEMDSYPGLEVVGLRKLSVFTTNASPFRKF